MLSIEEYLIGIGAKVDKASFRSAAAQARELAKTFTKAAAIIQAALTGVALATVKNVKATADADTGYAKLARQMWVTKGAAKELSQVLDAMGENQEDVAWIPELRQQYSRLRAELHQIGQPADFGKALKTIKELNYQWQSFQLKVSKLKETVSYYLTKYLAAPLERAGISLKKLNDYFRKNFYPIADWIARRLTNIINILLSLYRAGRAVFETVDRFVGELPRKLKATLAAITAMLAAFMAGPVGIMLMTIGMLLVLLEDFFGYIDGRKSSKTMAPVWKWLLEFGKSNKFQWIKGFLKDILNMLYEIFNLIKNIATSDFMKAFFSALATGAKHATAIGRVAVKLLTAFVQILNGDLKGALKTLESMGDIVCQMYPGKKAGAKGTIVGSGDDGILYSDGPLKQTPIAEGIEDEGLAKTDAGLRRAVDIVNAQTEGDTGQGFTVTSGWRSEENNRAVGGVPDSYHLYGRAVDLDLGHFSEEQRRDIENSFKEMGLETLYHNVKTGWHLHIELPYGTELNLPEVKELKLPTTPVPTPDGKKQPPELNTPPSLQEVTDRAVANANFATQDADAAIGSVTQTSSSKTEQKIENHITVQVAGSNSSADEIAQKVAARVGETQKNELGLLTRNEQPAFV